MADVQTLSDISNLKNSKILVNVEEAIRDVLVVSYEFDSKLFQGVLLDSTKRGLPCGIFTPSISAEADCLEEDKTHSVSQRFSYFQEKSPPHGAPNALAPGTAYHMRRAMRGGAASQARLKNSRMTVRLRPRQVLCSKCRSICNENSENVDLSKKRKGEEVSPTATSRLEKRLAVSPKSPRALFTENQQDNQPVATRKGSATANVDTTVLHTSLIPRLTRLQSNELGNKLKLVGNYWTSSEGAERVTTAPQSPGSKHSCVKVSENVCVDDTGVTGGGEVGEDRMVLRKKRNVGSMEDLWDESVFTEDSMRRTTPVIKISFGSQGEGTVLKIPAKVRSYDMSDSEAEEGDKAEVRSKDAINSAKAAKRALKRAKKEARRKIIGGTSPAYETLCHRRHKRKVKHKKRHKEARAKYDAASPDSNSKSEDERVEDAVEADAAEADAAEADAAEADAAEADAAEADAADAIDPHQNQMKNGSDSYSAIKERCLKQKLSISLRKLNATAYTRCDDSSGSGSASASAGSNSPGSNSELDATTDGTPDGVASPDAGAADGEVPDFPEGHPLMMRLSTQSVGSCLTGDGRTMEVGDVVWGKVHGFPWWPGKVLSISVSRKEDGATVAPLAHVAWYGSSTSSMMPCDALSPFLATFKTRYNKKKRGPYKEAIRQATCEARKDEHRERLKEVDVAS